MARETSYFVQAFNAGRGGNLKADPPIACKTENGALRLLPAGRASIGVRLRPCGSRRQAGAFRWGRARRRLTAPASVDEAGAGRLLERRRQ
jgi:hypothetical protein